MLDYAHILKDQLDQFLKEDDLARDFGHLTSLPSEEVECHLKIKDNALLAGLPIFFEVFNRIGRKPYDYEEHLKFEGQNFKRSEKFQLKFRLPFNVALTGERLALNLLQQASRIATHTQKYVQAAGEIKILDTRKTTPGLRFLEKYAVRIGGGHNHRFGQVDAWMIKDNHKTFFGGIEKAVKFFQDQRSFYRPLIVEIHNLEELKIAYAVGVKFFLLDNFSPEAIEAAVKIKEVGATYEVSGGINLDNIKDYVISGVDAISSGSLTYAAPAVDFSLKFAKVLDE